MKKMNKKGFTLIELLAVIIILGVLMIIAIPSVTTYIQNSRKSAYVDTAAAYVEAVRTKVNEGRDFQLYSTDTFYLIPVGNVLIDLDSTGKSKGASCVSVESGGQSPFSDTWDYAYVGVTYDGKGYNYFFTAQDGAGQGIRLVTFKELSDNGVDRIYSDNTTATTEEGMPKEVIDRFKEMYGGEQKENLTSDVSTAEGNLSIGSEAMGKLLGLVSESGKKNITVLNTCRSS